MKKLFSVVAAAIVMLSACNDITTKEETPQAAQPSNVQTAAQPESLLGKEWRLKELNGTPIVLDTTFPNYPHMKFDDLTKVGGNLGCNGFGGTVTIITADSINITQVVSTQMACPNLSIENGFREALEKARTYQIEGNTLLLNNDHKEVILKLEDTATP